MKRTLTAVLLLVLFHTSPQAQPAQAGGASLSGVVVQAGGGEPLSGAQAILTLVRSTISTDVTSAVLTGSSDRLAGDSIATWSVRSSEPQHIQPVSTGRNGRFVFQNLEPGLYSLQVFRNEYSRTIYGQRVAGGPAAGIRLAAGQSVGGLVISLVPAGNVAGVIRNSDGKPQAGVPIQLLRAAFNANGQRTFSLEGSATTNDRGEYRLYWITPGRYYISAGTASGPNRSLTPNSVAASLNEIPDQSFALTYFPGVAQANSAAAVDVLSGSDVTGIDFVVAPQQLHSVRGRIVDSASGRAPASASVSLAYRTLAGASGAFNGGAKYDDATGAFELRNVPPGSYVVQAIAAAAPSAAAGEAVLRISALSLQPNARLPIEVANADVDGVMLQLTAGVSLPGRITVDGTALSNLPGWERIQVPLKPTIDSSFSPNLLPAEPVYQRPRADGTFAIDGVTPGDFTAGPVTGLPQGYYVKEMRFNQADVLGSPLRFHAAESGVLEIALSSKAGSLSGMAVDTQMRGAAGVQLVLVPERQRERIDLYRTAASDTNGRFLFRGIPPGDYRVFGWEAIESYAYFDSELLRRAEPQSVPVHIAEAEANVTVRIIPSTR